MAHVCRELLGGSENENVEQTISRYNFRVYSVI